MNLLRKMLGLFDGGEDPDSPLEDLTANFRKTERARGALEQLDAEFPLQVTDRAAQMALLGLKLFSRPRVATALNDLHKRS